MNAIDPKKDPRRRCRPVNEWPEQDRRAWGNAFIAGDVLDPGGPGAGWSEYTKTKVAKGYGRFLTWLEYEGMLVSDSCPESRITPDYIAPYITHLQSLNASQTILSRIEELTLAMKVMAPRYDRTYLKQVQSVLRAQVAPARDLRARVKHAGELRELGMSLIDTARKSQLTPLQKAIDYRDGLVILLLSHVPLRRKNMSAIRFDYHFIEHGDELWINMPDECPRTRTKNGKPIDRPLPQELCDCLREYIAVHRPFLLKRRGRWYSDPGGALWISKDGSALTEMAFYDRIAKRTKAAFGFCVNPHLFRHSAATTIAIERPKQIKMAGAILGNNPTTSGRYYNLAKTIDAATRHHAALDKLRRKCRSRKKGD